MLNVNGGVTTKNHIIETTGAASRIWKGTAVMRSPRGLAYTSNLPYDNTA